MPQFNIRVYGILVTPEKEILVADELIRGKYYTKFPGGGLEYGEGTRDCLKREFKEEMDLEVKVTDHIYTTDYFQPSAFKEGDQIISIYYFVEALEPIKVEVRSADMEFNVEKMPDYFRNGASESFRLIRLKDLSPDQITLPIDKIVVEMVKSHFK